MASRSYRPPDPFDGSPLKRRVSGAALALGFNLALLFVLMGIGAFRAEEPKPSTALVVDMVPESHMVKLARPKPRAAEPVKRPPPPIPPITSPIPPIVPAPRPLDLIEMTREEMAAADIANLPKSGSSAGDSEEVGRGPHGEVLYAAEWARRPTDAELGGYLPRNAPDGYGLIACKTAPENRVEDCVELENFPRGSRLASAVRQAAWQFRVRPPRKGGRAMVGEWVRIRISYAPERAGGS
ncbi:MAG: hypothetical protein ACREBM_03415 [Sphingomicrobium sp.]